MDDTGTERRGTTDRVPPSAGAGGAGPGGTGPGGAGGVVGDGRVAAVEAALAALAADDVSAWAGAARAERLIGLLQLRDRLDALVVRLVGDWDAAGDWAADGAVSATGWLAGQAGLARSVASGLVRDGRCVRRHPELGEALARGDLGPGQVSELARAQRAHPEAFAAQVDGLVETAPGPAPR